MSSDDFDDLEDTELEEVEPGVVGEGGPSSTIAWDDEHGGALDEVDDDEL